jgi:hypothetical protein
VSIHDPFVRNLGIAKCWNWYDYPWIIHRSLPFLLYTCISPYIPNAHSSSNCNIVARDIYSADTAQITAWKGNYAYDITLSTANLASASYYIRISWKYLCSSGRYIPYRDLYCSMTHSVCTLATQLLPSMVRNISSSADSQFCTTSIPCGHLKCLDLDA